jgi:membrane protein DedA with SNARE-associated domain
MVFGYGFMMVVSEIVRQGLPDRIIGGQIRGPLLCSILVAALSIAGAGGAALAQTAPEPAPDAVQQPAQQPVQEPVEASAQEPVQEPTRHQSARVHEVDVRAHRMAKTIAADIERVEPYLERYGYWAVFAAVGVEGIGIPAPGQTLLEAGSLVAAVPDGKLNIWLLLFVAILATSLGQTIGYLIGRSGGRAVLSRMPISARSLEKIEDGFNRYGGWLVFFGRFVDGPRQLIGLFSGVLAMHWGRFMLLNIGGAILWASFWALGVYYLDLHFDTVVTALRQLNPWIAALTAIGLLVLLVVVVIALIRRRSPTDR